MGSHRFHLRATPESVGEIRGTVARLAEEVGLTDLWAVQYCVSEALSNVVLHAYPATAGDAEVVVEASDPGTLRISVKDNGVGFEPRSDSPGLGLGIPMIAKLASRVDVRSEPQGGTLLFMEFVESEMRARDVTARLA